MNRENNWSLIFIGGREIRGGPGLGDFCSSAKGNDLKSARAGNCVARLAGNWPTNGPKSGLLAKKIANLTKLKM